MECTQTNFDSGAASSGFHNGFRTLAFDDDDDDDDDDDLPWPQPNYINSNTVSDLLSLLYLR